MMLYHLQKWLDNFLQADYIHYSSLLFHLDYSFYG